MAASKGGATTLQWLSNSTGTIAGQLHGEFVHGFNPFYGSVVYLIPVTASTEEWWVRLARPRQLLVDPQQDRSLGFADRTTSDAGGRFQFSAVRPGNYFVYARVLWATAGIDTTFFGGGAWIATATVAARETASVVLRTPRTLFPEGTVPARRFPTTQVDPTLPRFGEYVYVEELPEPITKVPPAYPDDFSRGVVTGTVLIQFLVDRDGLVKDTRVTRSIPLLDEAAVAAVKQWVFKPALRDNKPVAVWIAVPVMFKAYP